MATPAMTTSPMTPPTPRSTNRSTLGWISASYGLAVLPLYSELSPLIYGIALLAIGWRYAIEQGRSRMPSQRQLNGAAVLGSLLIAVLSPQLGLVGSIFNLLVMGCTLKFLEFRQRRDLGLHILALFFLGGLSFVYHQHWLVTLYLLTSVLLNTAALLSLYLPTGRREQLRQASLLVAQSIPLMLVLFVILPRLGPLWQMPQTQRAITGLGEEVNPENITELTRSSELVFRASFSGPPPTERYWRTLVHESFDGHSWRMSPGLRDWQNQQQSRRYQPWRATPSTQHWQGASRDYRLYTEPSNQSWVYTLALSSSPDQTLLETPVQTLISPTPLTQKQQFALRYFPQQPSEPKLSPQRRQQNLALPVDGNPQARAMAAGLRRQFPDDDQALLQAALQYFRQQPFFYTLNPPPLSGDSIDQFLFSTRAGFCAHYASSLAFILRAAGIPARLVTGYLGGEYHPEDDYVSVHQFDAHAWIEVWQPGGWQRVDPTLMVAPDRIEQGLDALMRDQGFLAEDPLSLSRYRHIALLNHLRLALASLDYHWTVWILNYDAQAQEGLFKRWFSSGIGGRLLILLGGTLLALAIAIALGWLYRRKTPPDPLLHLYQQACLYLARSGSPRLPAETPSAYQDRLLQQGHPAARTLERITDAYLHGRYAHPEAQAKEIPTLRQLLRQLRRLSRRHNRRNS